MHRNYNGQQKMGNKYIDKGGMGETEIVSVAGSAGCSSHIRNL